MMKMGHVAMYVNDLEKARSFFEKYFEGTSNTLYENKETGFCSYFLSFEAGTSLELMSSPWMTDMEKPMARTGFVHIAFSVGSKTRVDELTNLLKKDGYEVVSGPRTTGDGYYESCILDFEGNQIEITV